MNPILIIQNYQSESPGSIIDFLAENNLPYEIIHSYKNHSYPELSKVETVINLGCPISVIDYYQHDYLKELYRFISEIVRADKPYLGICFGGQLLAKVLGAKVLPNKIKEIGTYKVRLTDDGINDSLFKGFNHNFPVFHWHSDTFKIPFGARQLVEGDNCKNQAFRKGNAVALQFHLETNPEEVCRWCDIYREELNETKKTKDDIFSTYKKEHDIIKNYNYRLLSNFFEL